MKPLFTLSDLLKEQLRDLYDAETQYERLLPNLIKSATSSQLRKHLEAIALHTRENISHLAFICGLLGVPPTGVVCEAMVGLIREAIGTTHEWGDTATKDAALISNAQRIVHYEIAGFGTAKAFAKCIGLHEAVRVLDGMVKVAVDNDSALTTLATGGWFTTGINHEAAGPSH